MKTQNTCPICGRPYGKRRRCYHCQPGRKRARVQKTCPVCGKIFEVQQYLENDKRGEGTYCSRECRYIGASEKRTKPLESRSSYVGKHGYVLVPIASGREGNSYQLEHRLVMEEQLGRELRRNEEVHHINGVKTDNRLENLQLVLNTEHHELHPESAIKRRRRVKLTCRWCGIEYEVKQCKKDTSHFCSQSCRSKMICYDRYHRN